ncbi:MAG: hypothetical protein JNK63_01410 [Chthonomonas sp.]|nr:hypothetical protein [Chthonomonas sp.]
MKKIGVLFGRENTFPWALIERINSKKIKGIEAEPVLIDKCQQNQPSDYAVVLDRISQDVPFYRAWLKNAALNGTAVCNNPFWWSADEKFFNNCLAEQVGVAVPKTVLLPSNQRPPDTEQDSFRNLALPLAWEEMFEYIGWPAFFKPFAGGGWRNVYKLNNMHEFFHVYNQTGQLTMMLQENIDFTDYFRCYCLGGDNVHVMRYAPQEPHHRRYVQEDIPIDPKMHKQVVDGVIALNQALGYDFNTVEFAFRDGVPYAIDFCNPAPDADIYSVGEKNFEWIIENAAQMLIKKAQNHVDGQMNLTWGTFVQNSVAGKGMGAAKKAPAKKKVPAKA